MKIVSIDPGKKGHIVSIELIPFATPILLSSHRLPYDGDYVDVGELQEIIIDCAPNHAIVERQSIRPRQAKQAEIMDNYGQIKATLALCGIKPATPTPQKWQKYHGVTGDKKEHIAKAEELGYIVPMALTAKGNISPTIKDDGFADALLLALFWEFYVTAQF